MKGSKKCKRNHIGEREREKDTSELDTIFSWLSIVCVWVFECGFLLLFGFGFLCYTITSHNFFNVFLLLFSALFSLLMLLKMKTIHYTKRKKCKCFYFILLFFSWLTMCVCVCVFILLFGFHFVSETIYVYTIFVIWCFISMLLERFVNPKMRT